MGNMINPISVKTGITLKEYVQNGWIESNLTNSEITTIRDYAFTNSGTLQTVEFPNADSIGVSAFQGCSNLTLFNFNKVSTIKNYAFQNCNLTGDIVLSLTKLTSSSGTYAFNNNKLITSVTAPLTTIIPHSCFLGCAALSSVTLPLAENFNDWCFSSNTALEELTLPRAKVFTRYVFANSGLKKLVLPRNIVATIASDTFNNTPIKNGTGFVYVPDDLLDSYKSATNWSTIADQIRPISMLYVENPLAWIDAEYNTMTGHGDEATTLTDLSGNGNNGTIGGALTYADKGYVFDGNAANYISMNKLDKLATSTGLTFELCVDIADLSATQRILYSALFYENFIQSSNLNIEERFSGERKRTTKTITTGQNTIAITLNGMDVDVYINGENVESYTLTTLSKSPADILIGQGVNTYPFSANSKFYSLRIYDRALTQAEIAQNHQNDVNRFSA